MTVEEKTPEQRALEVARLQFPLAHDPDAKHVLRWARMPAEARAAACAAAVLHGLPLDVDRMSWDPRSRIAFVWSPNPDDKTRRRMVACAVPATVEESLAPVRAARGFEANRIENLIRQR